MTSNMLTISFILLALAILDRHSPEFSLSYASSRLDLFIKDTRFINRDLLNATCVLDVCALFCLYFEAVYAHAVLIADYRSNKLSPSTSF